MIDITSSKGFQENLLLEIYVNNSQDISTSYRMNGVTPYLPPVFIPATYLANMQLSDNGEFLQALMKINWKVTNPR